MRIVVALGRAAVVRGGEAMSVDVARERADRAAQALAPLLRDHELVITHGMGAEVGVLIAEEPVGPSDAAAARPGGGAIGFLLEEAIRRTVPALDVATLLTCAVVDAADPEFSRPSKPAGPVYDRRGATEAAGGRTFEAAVHDGGYRRVVPSPEPVAILEEGSLLTLVRAGFTVIADTGGGVPVVVDRDGRPAGTEGVVDNDLTAALVATLLDADGLMLLTDVDAVYRDFGTPAAIPLRRLSTLQARELLVDGGAGRDTMGPKVEAACRFSGTDRFSVIAALPDAEEALRRAAGTRIADA